MFSRLIRLSALAVLVSTVAWSQSKPITVQPVQPGTGNQINQSSAEQPPIIQIPDLDKRPKMDEHERMMLIQAINAEFARSRKIIPLGSKDITLTPDGKLNPNDGRLYQLAMTQGSAAKVGDRIQITNIAIKGKSIYLEINGGPKKKSHWYEHVTISGMGGGVTPGNTNQNQVTGAGLSLEFKDHVPELTGPELKQLLNPIFDFSVKTAAEVYLETVPPKVKAAIKAHEVLVGMNHDMVIMSKDRPPQKLREKDEKGAEYEEWIYGQPPQDVTFVRFVGDEVTEVKTMKVTGEKILKTEKEVDVKDGVVSMAAATAQSAAAANNEQPASDKPVNKPSLKHPGEGDDPMSTHPNISPPQQQRPVDPNGGPSNEPPPQTIPKPQIPPPN
ncbi:MAG TPA: hypothetical protein VJA94_11200 [Candidatus Angelobacter sp.]